MTQREPKKILKIIVIILIVLSIGSYSLYQARNMLSGPKIVLENPLDGSTTHDPLIRIRGIAKNVSWISLNDRPIYIDEQGYFEEKLLLYPGYNIMKVTAKDRFGRFVEKKIEVVYTTS